MGEIDCVIIGAGASGLSAALKLEAYDVKILEARDRVGGRIFDDFGAGYVDCTQRRVLRMAKELGMSVKKVHDEGIHLVEAIQGEIRSYQTNGFPKGQSVRTMLAVGRIFASLEVSSKLIDCNEPWKCPHQLKGLENFSVMDYVNLRTKDCEAKEVVQVAFRAVFGSELSNVSLIWFLFKCKSCGSLSRLLAVSKGAQELKLCPGGFQELINRLSEKLKDRILTNAVVTHIDSKSNGIHTVCLEDGREFNTKHVIVAIQPSLYKSISFNPPFSASKTKLCESFSTGSYAKVRLVYQSPFWRNQGLSGQIATVCGPCTYFIDDCKESEFALIGFVTSRNHDMFWKGLNSVDDRSLFICKQLFECTGSTEAMKPISYKEHDWTLEQFTNGCVLALSPGASFDVWEQIREKHGEILFAGAETASRWVCYVDGAIQAGERSASRIVSSLGGECTYVEIEPKQDHGSAVDEKKNDRGIIEHFLLGRIISKKQFMN